MTLRRKVAIIIGVTLVYLMLVLYGAAKVMIFGRFTELEAKFVRQDLERALSVLQSDLGALGATAGDWGGWDDTYRYMEDRNEEYIESNLPEGTFTELGLNLILFVDTARRVAYVKAFDLHTEREVPFADESLNRLFTYNSLFQAETPDDRVQGLVMLPQGPMMVASFPILTSEDEGPARGTLIMGRFFNAGAVRELGEKVQLNLAVYKYDDARLPLDVQTAVLSFTPISHFFIKPLDGKTIAGYTLINDIAGRPGLILKASVPREISRQGQVSLFYFMVSLLIVGLVVGGVVLLLLNRVVLSRVAALMTNVRVVGASTDLSVRIPVRGRDELASLTEAINNMLEALEHSREATVLLDSLPAYAFCKDTEGSYITANQRFCEAIGRTKEEIAGATDRDLFPIHLAERYMADDQRVIESKTPLDIREEEIIDRGEPVVVTTRKIPLLDAAGEVVGLVGVAFDITERKRAEEKVLEYQRQLRSLASELTLTEERERRRLAAELHDHVGQTLALARIKLGTLHESVTGELHEQVDDLLTLQERIIQDVRSLTFELSPPVLYELGFAPAVEWLVDRMREEHGIETQYEDDGLSKPLGDDIRVILFQGVRELLVNVAKHARATRVKVSIEHEGENLHVRVEDNGIGLDLTRDVSGQGAGDGFGHFSIRERLRHVGGRLEMHSQPGRGTTATLTVPLKRQEANKAEAAHEY